MEQIWAEIIIHFTKMFALEQQLCSILKTKFIMLNFSKSLLQMNMYKKIYSQNIYAKIGPKISFCCLLAFCDSLAHNLLLAHMAHNMHTWCRREGAELHGVKDPIQDFLCRTKASLRALLCLFWPLFHPKIPSQGGTGHNPAAAFVHVCAYECNVSKVCKKWLAFAEIGAKCVQFSFPIDKNTFCSCIFVQHSRVWSWWCAESQGLVQRQLR